MRDYFKAMEVVMPKEQSQRSPLEAQLHLDKNNNTRERMTTTNPLPSLEKTAFVYV